MQRASAFHGHWPAEQEPGRLLLSSAADRSWSELAHCKGQRPAVACTEVPHCKAVGVHGCQQMHCWHTVPPGASGEGLHGEQIVGLKRLLAPQRTGAAAVCCPFLQWCCCSSEAAGEGSLRPSMASMVSRMKQRCCLELQGMPLPGQCCIG